MTKSSILNRCTETDATSGDENIAGLFANKHKKYTECTSHKQFRITRPGIDDCHDRLQTEDSKTVMIGLSFWKSQNILFKVYVK